MKRILNATLIITLLLTVFATSQTVKAISTHPSNIISDTDMCEDYDGYNWDYDSCTYIIRTEDIIFVEYQVLGSNANATLDFYELNGASLTKVESKPLSQGLNTVSSTTSWTHFKINIYYEDPTPGMISKLKDSLYIGYVNPLSDIIPPEFISPGVYFVDVDSPITANDVKAVLSANDITDGDVTSSISLVTDGYIGNEDTIGDYIIRFSAADLSSNISYVDVTVRVVDITIPVLSLIGDATIYVPFNGAYTEQGATYTDNYYNTGDAISSGTVDTTTLGTYTINYSYTDPSGNIADEIQRTVIVHDNELPVLSLNGDSTMYIEYNNTYTELGATFSDNFDGSGNAEISGTVTTSILGTYIIEYNYTDTSSNQAVTIQRTVIVQDTTKPVITLTGPDTIYIEYQTTYADEGATFTDNYDSAGNAVSSNDINNLILGTYTITYTYTDSSGNTADPVTRTVIVRDTLSPIVDGLDNVEVYNSQGVRLPEILANVTATDGVDGDVSNTLIIIIDNYTGNEYQPGSYTVTIRVFDTNGNMSTIEGTINVLDDIKPEFTVSPYIIDFETASSMTQEEIRNHILNR